MDETRSIAIAAGALSMAASQIRFDDRPGKLSVGLGGGYYESKGALAVGLGYTAPSQLWRANVAGSFAGSDHRSFGAGLSFTLN